MTLITQSKPTGTAVRTRPDVGSESPEELTDDTAFVIIAGARSGSEWAWRAIAAHYLSSLEAFAGSKNAEDPAGIANTSLLELARAISNFRGNDKRALDAYVYRIARNRMADEFKKKSVKTVSMPDDELLLIDRAESSIESDIVGNDWIAEALLTLSEEQRKVVELRILEDRSVEETAIILDKKPGAIHALQHRAIRALRVTMAVVAALFLIFGIRWATQKPAGIVDSTPASESEGSISEFQGELRESDQGPEVDTVRDSANPEETTGVVQSYFESSDPALNDPVSDAPKISSPPITGKKQAGLKTASPIADDDSSAVAAPGAADESSTPVSTIVVGQSSPPGVAPTPTSTVAGPPYLADAGTTVRPFVDTTTRPSVDAATTTRPVPQTTITARPTVDTAPTTRPFIDTAPTTRPFVDTAPTTARPTTTVAPNTTRQTTTRPTTTRQTTTRPATTRPATTRQTTTTAAPTTTRRTTTTAAPTTTRATTTAPTTTEATTTSTTGEPRVVPRPTSCKIQLRGLQAVGVEVQGSPDEAAGSYALLDILGREVVRVANPQQQSNGEIDFEPILNVFDANRIYSVAAVENGVQSRPRVCTRTILSLLG